MQISKSRRSKKAAATLGMKSGTTEKSHKLTVPSCGVFTVMHGSLGTWKEHAGFWKCLLSCRPTVEVF